MAQNKNFDLHERLGYKLALAARVNDQILDNMLSGVGLTRQMWCVLIAVGEQAIKQPSDIASYIGINRTAASRTLRDMERKGLLKRSNGSRDRRSTDVALTSAGWRLLASSLPMAEQSQIRLQEKLSHNERRQLARLLDKFLTGPHTQPPSI